MLGFERLLLNEKMLGFLASRTEEFNQEPETRLNRSELLCNKVLLKYKGDKSWVFIGRTDAKAETTVLWPPHAQSWLIGKDPDAGRDWGQEKNGTTEDEMAGWHHRLDGYEFGWTPGVGVGQGGLACCDSWGRQESDTTEWLNWTERLWDEENKHRYAQWHPVFILFSLFKFYVGTACSLWRILISIKKANKPKRKL